jgi:alcohol dehydrogenase
VLTTAHGSRSVLKLEEDFDDPVAAADEAVIEVRATAVNYHDIFTRLGMAGVRIDLPVIVSSGIAGVVRSVGSDADQHWVGKRVLVDPVFNDKGVR